ncbi:methyl-accepting chemotaxis protein, partial [Roseisolibacter sp. H3M3-2]|uniref:HAMP domain-containing methyl-accepting chemotaxis protein n=1 Tax=Roseisolibacter sp. H3M3-2 TaxID=3031323 RepID=UPI0023DBD0DD
MRWFRNLPLARKLAASFTVLVALTGALGALALRGTSQVNDVAVDLGKHWLPSVRYSLQVSRAAAAFRGAEALTVASNSAVDIDGYTAEMDVHQETIDAELKKLGPTLTTKDDSAAFAEFKTGWASYRETSGKVVAAAKANDDSTALELLAGDSQMQFDGATAALGRIVDASEEGAKAQVAVGAHTFQVTQRSVLGAVAFCVLFGIGVAIGMARDISRPMREIAAKMRRLALGDTDVEVQIDTKDEVGVLAASFREIVGAQVALADAARRVAAGDVSVPITPRSEADRLTQSFAQVQATLQALIAEGGVVVAAAKRGDLSARGEAEKFEGAYRELVDGMNGTLAAVAAPTAEVNAVLERVADRDMRARMEGSYAGEFEALKARLNATVETLDQALAQVARSAEQVAGASGEIAAGSASLAHGSSQQAGSLQEVSASLHELASTAKQNAANAQQARGMAENARSGAAAGVSSMAKLSDAVSRIKQSSDATAKIVKTIDEIAFQTNLLALNAAVEAARAGDAGRGFAVVAEEVRALALRSAEAARSTGAMIEESVRNADAGVSLNAEVLAHLQRINADVDRVTEVMAEIAAASEQQDQGVGQINGGLESMNAVTQQVAASAEQSASAATELSSQSEAMRELVGTFRLTEALAERAERVPAREERPAERPQAAQPAAAPRPTPAARPA